MLTDEDIPFSLWCGTSFCKRIITLSYPWKPPQGDILVHFVTAHFSSNAYGYRSQPLSKAEDRRGSGKCETALRESKRLESSRVRCAGLVRFHVRGRRLVWISKESPETLGVGLPIP